MNGKGKKYKIWIIFCIFLITIFFLLPQEIGAASFHTLSDRMSRGAPSALADHLIKFTTSTGVSDANQYIRISFDSGFNLSLIDYTDIDLLHGPVSGEETAEILNSVPSATAWGAQVTGNSLDLTHPNNSANGDILPGDKVVIKIGLNAVGGDRQILNPATIGSKIISLTSNFGDSGKLALAIYQDQIGVGGQTAGAPPNPVVLNLPTNVTQNSLDLSWSQNNDWDFDHYELYQGSSAGVTNLTGVLVFSTTDNLLTEKALSGLSAGRDYYFVLYVFDNEGLFSFSNEVIANTQSTRPPFPPKPQGLTVEPVIFPYYLSGYTLQGLRPQNTIVLINGLADNSEYPTATTWQATFPVEIGNNYFEIWARDNYGQNSNIISVTVERWRVGDTNGNYDVNDFDLSGVANNWDSLWAFADFNHDSKIDDFDLAGLAANWDDKYQVLN